MVHSVTLKTTNYKFLKVLIIKVILIFIFFTNVLFAKTSYFNEGVNLFNKEKFEKLNSNLSKI